MLNKIRLIVKGFLMGAADVVPGVSGGTVAFILGIYQQLIDAICSFDKKWLNAVIHFDLKTVFLRPHFSFLIPLVLGIFLAVVFFTKVVPLPQLIVEHPEQVYGLFFGLILGSIAVLFLQTRHIMGKGLIFLIFGIIFGFFVVNLVPVATPEAWWFIFLCGFVAISAMLLPGISGSFILLILGKYAYILGAVGAFNFAVILPFILGCICGIVAFSRFISWLLSHFYNNSILCIKGILIASLWVIWPFQDRHYVIVREKQRLISSSPIMPEYVNYEIMVSLLLIVLGFVIVLFVDRFSKHKAIVVD